ncbi:hypothetical protein [Methanobrevibacter sp.]|uniref:hypothetical protein n=1 Tax=Methanobrevibacter sp. TaxID=66852 RepID=UPI003890BE3A
MGIADFLRYTILAFIASILITLLLYIGLDSLKIKDLIYLSALFGMYVFAAYGVNLLIDNEIVPNNYSRFVLAIIFIAIYSVVFIYLIPQCFGPDSISHSHALASWGYFGIGSEIVLNKEFYLTIFGVFVLIVNYLDYRKG